MKELQFKTTMKCGGCVANLKPLMEEEKEIAEWSVDLESKDKILTVKGEDLDTGMVLEKLKQAGFEGKEIKRGIFKKVFGS